EGATAMTYYNKPAKLATGVEQRIIDAVHRQISEAFKAKAHVGTEPTSPLSPQQSQRRLQIPAECRIQLVAAEPLTTDPVAIDFGTENYQARVNSLTYGLDGWVYGACGLFGGSIRSSITGQTIELGNRDFRIDPDRGPIEPLTGRTQQGRVRTDDGDWFGCNN